MRLHVVGTGSSGNCSILEQVGQRLILDAGMPMKDVLKVLGGISGVEGCLVTHEHLDHAGYASQMAGYGIPMYATAGTIEENMKRNGSQKKSLWNEVEMLKPIQTKSFLFLPFHAEHDAKEPCGFLIRHIQSGIQVLYATDTYYLRNRFPGINFWLIECNFVDEILKEQAERGLVERQLMNRLRTSHMSLSRLKQTLEANDLTQTRKIILLHLSNERSDEERMVSEITEATGIETVAANAGMIIDLEMTPF